MKKLAPLFLIPLYCFTFQITIIFGSEINGEEVIPVSIPAYEDEAGLIMPPELVADSAILIDGRTGDVLYEKDMYKRQYPASITKIMTTLLAIETGNLTDTITVSDYAVDSIGIYCSKLGALKGEEINFLDSLYAIMLASANDMAVAVGEHLAGSEEAYAKLMTERAHAIGALDTQYQNAHGLPDEGHYTTAYDMSLIAREAIENELFRDIISIHQYVIPPTNLDEEPKTLNNRHKMVTQNYPAYYYEGTLGGKTGFTDASMHTLVTYAEKNAMQLIAVVLKDPQDITYTDTKVLFDYGFNYFSDRTLFVKTDLNTLAPMASVPVFQFYRGEEMQTGEIFITAEGSFTKILRRDVDESSIEKKIHLPDSLEAPVNAGEFIGTLEFILDGESLGAVNLMARNSIAYKTDQEIRAEAREEFIEDTKEKLPIYLTFVPIIIILTAAIIRLIIKLRNKNKTTFGSKKHYKLPKDKL